MATARDVAQYILNRQGAMTAMKLQKLVYYSQAWSLVWDEKPLFKEPIQAWANGPVCPQLYHIHRGMFEVQAGYQLYGNPDALTDNEKDTVNSILNHYGDKTGQWLSQLTHSEAPWVEARKGLGATERSNAEITHAAMNEYYGSL